MKRLGLSGGVIVVTALMAAMVTSAAYGITRTVGVQGELDPIACVNATGGSCTQAVNMDEPTGLALSDDQSRVFVATHSSDGMSIFVLDRKTRLMSQYRLDRGGCINETGTGGCFDGRGLDGAMGVTSSVSHTYVAAETSGAVTLIRKKTTTKIWDEPTDPGACISDTGSDGCSDGRGLPGARSVAFSADHHFVYVGGTKSIAVFRRDTQTGLLTQLSGSLGCVNDDGSDGCANGYIPDNVNDIVASDDGKTLYAASSGPGNGALLVFDVNKADGSITQKPGTAGCFSDDGSGGACTDGVALVGPMGIALDHNGNGGSNLYLASYGSNAVDAFTRDSRTGALQQMPGTNACVSDDGTGGACVQGKALVGPRKLVVYKTNRFVYVTAGDGVASFSRNKVGGVITQLGDPSGCTTDTGSPSCLDGDGLAGAWGIATTGGSKNALVAGSTSDAIESLKIK